MSLINDALKRANAAQQQTTPPPIPRLQPAESSQYARHSVGLMVPAALVLIALVGLFLVWQRAEHARLVQAVAASRLNVAAGDGNPEGSSPMATNALPAAITNVSPQPGETPAPASAPAPAPQAPGATASVGGVTNSVAAPPPPSKPAPPRLQAIFFTPPSPSVMIGGKTLLVGDRLGELRVVAITQDSATLAGAGQTNVLRLPE
jgi:hypothetical protein